MPSLAQADTGELQWAKISSPELVNLCDIAVAPEPRSLFAATYNSSGPEVVWRSAGEPLGKFWGSVLTLDTTSDRIILRLSPDYSRDYTIYVAEVGGYLIALSHDRGNSWEELRAPGRIVDLIVQDKDTIYIALPGGFVQKSTDAVWTWQEPVDSGLSEINMLTVAEEGMLFVGGRNGEVAYSQDGGNTFSKIPEDIGKGDVQVVADIDYSKNGVIYAATNLPDEGIWRWSLRTSTAWQQIDRATTAQNSGQCVAGLAVGSEGTLYALRLEPVNGNKGGVVRFLNPSSPNLSQIEVDSLSFGLPMGTSFDPNTVFPNTLPYLKLSGNSEDNELWAVDTANDAIYQFQDTLCMVAPTLATPGDGTTILPDCGGYIYQLGLSWLELPGAITYEVAIYRDSTCIERIWLGNSDTTGIVVSDNSSQLATGNTYYWRVRSVSPIKSQWSEVRRFAVGFGAAGICQAVVPGNGAADVSISNISFVWNPELSPTEYEITLSKNADLSNPIITTKTSLSAYQYAGALDYSTTYFWGVRITRPVSGLLAVFTFSTRATPDVIASAAWQSPSAQAKPVPLATTPNWAWLIIGICLALIAATLILIFRSRHSPRQ
ncbi:MAG: hypothetical protein COT13_00055 [Chloroflexi bacterium CG08_land_8_20_14_0_20_45_12]|nr:MAG: hypothetical protein AUK00_01525 [Dehalococcoidia bacterium CG2_30_46_9]PIU23999.1 MAG: hypothetical protein COT13_00055 [Chloroflexi bacterium CG08_land_8_20_14_0_20_45_12]